MSELPPGWAEAVVMDVCELRNGRAYKRNELLDKGKYPVLRVGNFFSNRDWYYSDLELEAEKYCDSGDLLYAWSASFGPKIWNGGKVIFHYHIWRVDIEPKLIEKRFLFHWFEWDKENIKSDLGTGSTMIHVTKGSMEARPLSLPPLPEQKRIVLKVDGLTTRTARARKDLDRIPTLIARYKRRLLDLAASGNLTKDWQRSDQRTGWNEVSIEEIAEATFDGPFGSNLKSADYVAKGIRVVRLENIGSLSFIREKETYISKKKYEGLKRHTLQADDVLFSSFIAEEIRVCRFPENLPTAAINKADCFCVRPNSDQCLPAFLTFRLAAPQTYEVLKEAVHGATRPRISLKQLKAFAFELPSLDEQQEIVRRVESAFGWLDRLAADHAAAERLLPKLDAAILERAFRGELVPQDPNDEPASVLLDRIKAERAATPKKKRGRKPRLRTTPKELMTMAKNLEEALSEAGDWISAQDAFQRCGIGTAASTGEIEALYAELRRLDKDGKLETEAVNDKQGRKLHDRLRLKAA